MKSRRNTRNFQFGEQQIAQRQAEDADDPRLTVEQAARYLGVSVPTLNRWRSTGNGPTWTKLGSRVYYRVSELKAFRS
ncbi:helix-turn-helix domain-containing protein [Mesorhizobium sp. ISC11]|uniref:helix-turn-helix domain-containing protein n=1 Tax=Mesorhizobium sp. ISC11 TaxID=3076428 RepID=UPI00301B6E39